MRKREKEGDKCEIQMIRDSILQIQRVSHSVDQNS